MDKLAALIGNISMRNFTASRFNLYNITTLQLINVKDDNRRVQLCELAAGLHPGCETIKDWIGYGA